jgi:hypothetical protein
MRGPNFGLGERLDETHEGIYPLDKVEIPKTTVVPTGLDYKSKFKAPDGKEVTGEDFINKPEYTVNVLNNTYNTDVFIYSSKHPNRVLFKYPKDETITFKFFVTTPEEIEDMLKLVSGVFSQNTEYLP